MRRLACLALTLLLPALPARAQDLVLTNARILDPLAQTITEGSVWIADGRIVGVGPAAPADAPGERIDLAGRWLAPGLVDLHTHSFGNTGPGGVTDGFGTPQTATRVLRAGVTAFLDLFAPEMFILPLRERLRTGDTDAARVFASGPCFTAPEGHCSEYGVPTRLIASPDEARSQIAELAPARPDVIKVVYDNFDYGPSSRPTIDRPTLEALVAAATERGLRTIVHVGTWEDVRHAVLAGAAAVTHVPGDGIVPDDVVALMAQHATWHIPTLVVQIDLAEILANPALVDTPLFAALASDTLRAVYRQGMSVADARTQRWVERQLQGKAAAIESVRRLHAGGVRMLVGTDAGNLGTIQGYSVHREMIRLVEAGLSPWDALAAATTSAGEFLGQSFGVRPGDDATFVILNESPIADIENTQDIAMVVLEGRVVYRS